MQKIAENEQNAVHKRQIVKILLSGSIFLSALSSSIYYGTYILSHNSETVPPFIGLVFIFFLFLWLINEPPRASTRGFMLIQAPLARYLLFLASQYFF